VQLLNQLNVKKTDTDKFFKLESAIHKLMQALEAPLSGVQHFQSKKKLPQELKKRNAWRKMP